MRKAALLAVVGLAVWAPGALALPPTITPTVTGQTGDNGWYVGNVIVNWTITPPYLIDFGCGATQISADTTGTKLECQAENAGDAAYLSVTIRLDKTAPSVVANADRAADAGGFYNHPLTATWTGVDGTSGVAACTSTPYAGPDGTGLSLTGTCKDKAGNISAAVPFLFNYDATPPVLTGVTVSPDDGAARLAWQASGAAKVMVMRSPAGARAAQADVVYDGTGDGFTDTGLKNGTRYTYLVQAIDAAGNTATGSASVTPSAEASTKHLLSPGAGGASAGRRCCAGARSRGPATTTSSSSATARRSSARGRPSRTTSSTACGPTPASAIGWARRPIGGCSGPGTGTAASTATASCWASAPSSSAEARHNPRVRCLYVDLDGTLLGAGGAVTRDGEGGFTLLGVRALEACHRAGALVVAMSGRPRAVLGEDVRLLGMDEYVFEGGAGLRRRR